MSELENCIEQHKHKTQSLVFNPVSDHHQQSWHKLRHFEGLSLFK